MKKHRRVAGIAWAVCWLHGFGAALCFREGENAIGGFLLSAAILMLLAMPFLPLMWMDEEET
jgi:hypothetical protein